ncbi:MAG: hypothetical protein ACKV2Q_06225 [Planctomycetaceae bacterium]
MDLIAEQCRRNVAADDSWTRYSAHRERVTRTLLDARTVSAERLCLLGAGNLNDFDLAALLTAFREIVLVDVDADALQRGLARQGLAGDARFQMVAPVDVSGVFAELTAIAIANGPADEAAIERCLQSLAQTPDFGWKGSCDVVASVGLLTQLIDGVTRTIDESHPRSWDVVSALRTQHLRLMLELASPGGAAVLVTEVVSSDSCPALLSVGKHELSELLRREISARNFFTGTSPAALQQWLRTDVRLAGQLASVRFSEPWLWTFLVRTYAVYSVTLRKFG